MLLASSANTAAAQGDNIRDLPVVELRAKNGGETLAIVLSGDGGWADIDKEIGKQLSERGVDVIGFDDRKYLMTGHRNVDSTAADVARIANHFMKQWGDSHLVLVGYSRGAAFAPFIATRLPDDLKGKVSLLALLGLPEHVSYTYHFSDLWSTRTSPNDPPILPELERLRGINMMCVYGVKEDESLCREVDTTLVHPVAREGAHHFDGDYRAITDLIVARMHQAP